MQFTKFGQTGLTVSRMILGTGTFGKQTDEKEAHRMLDPHSVVVESPPDVDSKNGVLTSFGGGHADSRSRSSVRGLLDLTTFGHCVAPSRGRAHYRARLPNFG